MKFATKKIIAVVLALVMVASSWILIPKEQTKAAASDNFLFAVFGANSSLVTKNHTGTVSIKDGKLTVSGWRYQEKIVNEKKGTKCSEWIKEEVTYELRDCAYALLPDDINITTGTQVRELSQRQFISYLNDFGATYDTLNVYITRGYVNALSLWKQKPRLSTKKKLKKKDSATVYAKGAAQGIPSNIPPEAYGKVSIKGKKLVVKGVIMDSDGKFMKKATRKYTISNKVKKLSKLKKTLKKITCKSDKDVVNFKLSKGKVVSITFASSVPKTQ